MNVVEVRLKYIDDLIKRKAGRDHFAKLLYYSIAGSIALEYCVRFDECYYKLLELLEDKKDYYEEQSNYWGE